MYEFGNVYSYSEEKAGDEKRPLKGYSEKHALGIWVTGNAAQPSWNQKAAEADIYMLKGVVEDIFRRMGVSGQAIVMEQSEDTLFAAKLSVMSKSNVSLGEIGVLRKRVIKAFDIDQLVAYAEIYWDNLFSMAAKSTTEFKPLAKTMDVRRDLALLLDKNVKFDDVEKLIRKYGGKLLQDVILFDVYEGKNLPEGKKSYAVAITLRDDEKTLKDKQIDAIIQRVIDTLVKELGASLR